MASTNQPNYFEDEESSLMSQNGMNSSYPLEVDLVEERYTNVRAGSSVGSKLIQNLPKMAFATTLLLIFISSYPYAIKFMTADTVSANFKNEAAGKPNFVFVLVDDVGWNSIGMNQYDLGSTTPFLNSMFSKGITLENYYSQEMCTPARSALFTGRYPFTVGMQYGSIDGFSEFAVPSSEILVSDVLKESGYSTYGLGKWNLGHYKPQFLPTARGFDYFLGFMDGANFYWSKLDPIYDMYYDFMYLDKHCYGLYDGVDREDYATIFYTTKAVDAIKAHKFEQNPMFLYMAYQAAHEPFHDKGGNYASGLPEETVGSDDYGNVLQNVVGGERQQYAMSLVMLDKSVEKIYNGLKAKNQHENTYFIIASDNGGCYGSGGRNGPLRGSKGSLYEGGTKVDAYLYSDSLPKRLQGSTYKGLFHVTDWFPTILGLAGINYTPTEDHRLDGYDQSNELMKFKDTGISLQYPRDTVIYNIVTNVDRMNFDLNVNAPFGVRNGRYKLLHAYEGNEESKTYYPESTIDNDDNLFDYLSCTTSKTLEGTYTKYLFDLEKDPFETNNLYGQAEYAEVQAELYDIIYKANVKEIERQESCSSYTNDESSSSPCEDVFLKRGSFIQPWIFSAETGAYGTSYPSYCTPSDNVFSPLYRR